ncbi:MAG: outer membrane lipoprotein chaperone LolA [Proteobacteria bacterium]|nr:outer membrane lipoprotein chaperone LolA [Pseudomonadota bacterium]
MFQIAITNLLALIFCGLMTTTVVALENTSAAVTTQSQTQEDVADARALISLIDDFDGVRAEFKQQILDSSNQVIDESNGLLALKRPNFRWQVTEPFAQVIVAKGARLQIYDADLAQVTLQDLDASSGATPLTLLLGDTEALTTDFAIQRTDQGGQQRFFLYPKSEIALFLQIELRFVDRKLQYLGVWDSAGQFTRIRLNQLKLDQTIADEVFELVLPEGTDVIRG